MKNRIHDAMGATRFAFTNGTGDTIAGGSVFDGGALGFGIVVDDVADGGTGVAERGGVYKLPKATGGGTGFAMGDAVGWDASAGTVVAATNGRSIGAVWKAAADGDDTVEVHVPSSPGPEVFMTKVTGDASGSIEVDTGFGQAPASFIVQSWSAAGGPRTHTLVLAMSGGDAGKIVIQTGAGAASDTHNVFAIRD